jgi:hypothetical protein
MPEDYTHPVKGQGFTTEYASAALVFGALIFLIMVRRGFRGASIGGISVAVK